MPWSLERYYGLDNLHFITCSCYRRKPLLNTPERRDCFLSIFEQTRERYRFVVVGYVVMLEHFHILVSEPEIGTPSTVMQVLKQRSSVRILDEMCGIEELARCRDKRGNLHLWTERFYDLNIWTEHKSAEKLQYMHENPVKRGLVLDPADWHWSSYRDYECGIAGPVKLNQWPEVKLKKIV